MNNIPDWEAVKDFYKEAFGIDGWVVEIYANLDILTLCVSGASNETVVKFLDIPLEDVKKAIKDTLEFEGWSIDLPINPYKIYRDSADLVPDSLKDYTNSFLPSMALALKPYPEFRDLDIEKVYYMCKTLSDLEREIQNEWI